MSQTEENNFAFRLKALTEALGLSPKKMEKSLGLSENNIYNYITRKKEPGISLADKIVKVYPRVRLEWLISGEGDMFKPLPDSKQHPSGVEDHPAEKAAEPILDVYKQKRDARTKAVVERLQRRLSKLTEADEQNKSEIEDIKKLIDEISGDLGLAPPGL